MHHWNLVADPGTHAYKDVMPAVLYGWEIQEACYPPFQYLLPGKGGVTIFDCELEDDMVQMSLEMKLERVATYRQLQGMLYNVLSNKIPSLSHVKIFCRLVQIF